MKNPARTSSAGFTLVELLVVIVIIITLAAVSTIEYSRVRTSGDQATTVAVMRQLQVANISYSTENSGQYVQIAELDQNDTLAMEWCKNPKFLAHLTGDL